MTSLSKRRRPELLKDVELGTIVRVLDQAGNWIHVRQSAAGCVRKVWRDNGEWISGDLIPWSHEAAVLEVEP